MPTGKKKANLFVNRLLSATAMKQHFLDYLVSLNDDVFASLMQGSSGVLDSDKIGLGSGANNTVSLDATLANKVVVAGGQVITVNDNTTSETADVPFENANGSNYYVGVRYASVPADTVLNAKRGTPEYSTLLDTFGDKGNPDSVTVSGAGTGSNLRLVLDSLLENGVDHSGRIIRVWMRVPVVGVDAVAIKEYTSQYDAISGNNFIDIPYSVAAPPLGQDVSSNPPSSTATDYECLVKGISIRKNTDLRLDSNYAFIGIVQGNDVGGGAIPVTFDLADQKSVFLITLDKAYDGIGSGAGNTIDVDVINKPVTMRSFPSDTVLRPDQKHIESFVDPQGVEIFRTEQFGRKASVPRFADDFMYSDKWAGAATAPARYFASEIGAASLARIHPQTGHPLGGHGVLELTCDAANGDQSSIGSAIFTVLQRLPRMYARIAIRSPHANWRGKVALGTSLAAGIGKSIGFEVRNNNIVGVVKDGAAESVSPTLRTLSAPDSWYDCYMVVLSNTTVAFWVGRSGDAMTVPTVVDFSALSWDFSTLAADDRFFSLAAQSINELGAGVGSTLLVDFWETWIGTEIRSFKP